MNYELASLNIAVLGDGMPGVMVGVKRGYIIKYLNTEWTASPQAHMTYLQRRNHIYF